ncbi:MAG: DUF1330 domain-containing protein [Pseudomonadota bacterium]
MSEGAALLIIRCAAPDVRFRAFVDKALDGAGLIGSARLHEVEALEPGTVPAHSLVLEFPSREAARDAWATLPLSLIERPSAPLALLVSKVPETGFDDPSIPTRANVTPGEDAGPMLMLIEGSASDQDVMNVYRDIILPMMFERHAYYIAFELGGDVEVLSGTWDEAIFAISRWPSRAAARSFWLSDRYQNDAIPLRLDIGKFSVALMAEHQ